MKKIWIWNHDATCMFSNKGGRHYWFAQNLKAFGYHATIFCSNINHFNGKEIEIKKVYKEDVVEDIPFIFIKTPTYRGNGIKRILNWIAFYIRLFPVSKRMCAKYGKPDVILASSVHPLTMVAGIQIARRFKIPCICEIRDLWPEAIFQVGKANKNGILGRVLVAGEHWIYKNADALIFTKEGDTDYLSEHKWLTKQGGDITLEKCHYINNGVDFDAFIKAIDTKSFKDETLDNDKFKIIYTGTIRQVNNLDMVLECASLLKGETDIQFLIYGDGDYLEALKQKAASQGLDNIIFKGYVNKQYIPYILSRSSLNLLNYSQNLYNWSRGNSSNKLFEYMASGKPILSTVRMGYSPIENYQCGISLDECNAKQMAAAIVRLKSEDSDVLAAMGENARNGAKDFDFKVLTRKLVDVIGSVTC